MATATTDFHKKVAERKFGIVTYGMTPPKAATEQEKLETLGKVQAARLRSLPVDAVILYDIHDEKDRTPNSPRPFPFAATLDNVSWARKHLGDVGVPYVFFRCIAKYTKEEFETYLNEADAANEALVIVGAASSGQRVEFDMGEAYAMRKEHQPRLPLGAVAIPERHVSKGDEHLRMWKKQTEGGVTFFSTQCVYNLEEAKNMLSDYHRHCAETNTPMVPVLITLTPCGSAKTLEFLHWLGVKVSKWIENDLLTTTKEGGIVEESVEALLTLFRDLAAFAARKGIPLGCNVESVAIRKAEIDASIRLVSEVRRILDEFNPDTARERKADRVEAGSTAALAIA
jgi:5,10-methylenetetrahydrofolate reductase